MFHVVPLEGQSASLEIFRSKKHISAFIRPQSRVQKDAGDNLRNHYTLNVYASLIKYFIQQISIESHYIYTQDSMLNPALRS